MGGNCYSHFFHEGFEGAEGRFLGKGFFGLEGVGVDFGELRGVLGFGGGSGGGGFFGAFFGGVF